MTGHAFRFGETPCHARPSGALWLPEARLLTVSDLHLGRAQRGALHGGAPLPPWEAQETLDRLAAEIEALDPAHVIALGDSFDDDSACARLDPAAASRLQSLCAGRRWTWIAGNHDPAPLALPGALLAEWRLPGGPVFRHIAEPNETAPEVCGHYHPKARLGPGPSRRCFVLAPARLILPAFGAFAGGLSVEAPPLVALAPEGLALLCRPADAAGPARILPAPLAALRGGAGMKRRSKIA